MQLDATCIAVDTWMGDEHAGFYDDSIYGNLRAYQQSMYRDFSHMLRMTFDEALSHIPDGSVDLLHLDGRHFYEDIKHDYETWKPKLSERGIVLFHDTQVRERNFGVWKFWAELRDHYPSFEFEHQHGLGVLGVGSAPEVQNFPLFREGADPEIAQRIRLGYQALGGMLDGPALRRNTECPCGSGMKYKHCHGSYA
jgi:hypothetical protein